MHCFGKPAPKPLQLLSKSESTSNTSTTDSKSNRDNLTCITEAPPGRCLTGGTDKNIVLNNYEQRTVERTWSGHDREITALSYGRSKNIAVSGSRDKLIYVWPLNRSKPIECLPGHQLVVTALAIHPKSNDVICSGSRDNSMKLWDINKGTCLRTASCSRNLVTHVTWSPTTDLIVQTGEDKEVKMWDPRNLEIIHSFPKKMHIQTCCDVSRVGKYCVSSSNGFNGNGCEATLWDLRQRRILHEYHGHQEGITFCLFLQTPSGIPVILTVSKDETLRVWARDVPSCVAVLPMDGMGLLTGVVAPTDDTILVSTFKRGIQIIKVLDHNDMELQKIGEF